MSANIDYRAVDFTNLINIDSKTIKNFTTGNFVAAPQINFQECLEESSKQTPKQNSSSDQAEVKSQNYQTSQENSKSDSSIKKSENNNDVRSANSEEKETTETSELDDVNDDKIQGQGQGLASSFVLLDELVADDNSELPAVDDQEQLETKAILLNDNEEAVSEDSLFGDVDEVSEQSVDTDNQSIIRSNDIENSIESNNDLEIITTATNDIENSTESNNGLKISDSESKSDIALKHSSEQELTNKNDEVSSTASTELLEKNKLIQLYTSKASKFNRNVNQDEIPTTANTDKKEALIIQSKITVTKSIETNNSTNDVDDADLETAVIDTETADTNDMSENNGKSLENHDFHTLKTLENNHSGKNDTIKNVSTQAMEENNNLLVEKFTNVISDKLQNILQNNNATNNSKITELTIENEGIKFTVTIESSKGLLNKVNITSDDPTSIKLLIREPSKLEQALQKIQGAEDCSLTFNQHQGQNNPKQHAFMTQEQLKIIYSEQGSNEEKVQSSAILSLGISPTSRVKESVVDICC